MVKYFLPLFFMYVFLGCREQPRESPVTKDEKRNRQKTYSSDLDFLRKYAGNLLELSDSSGQARVLLSERYQGRVFTSTAGGDSGNSYGWINYDLLSSGALKSQFNPVGGEERFWMGPEGGQYSIFFKPGDSFHIGNWQVPAFIDTESFQMTESDRVHAVFAKKAVFKNYAGTTFNIDVQRKISLLDTARINSILGRSLPSGVKAVGYESENKVRNLGSDDWTKEKGLLSIWLLGMFSPSPETSVIIPFYPVKNARSYVHTDYFGAIPPSRLKVFDSVMQFICDGKYRSKLGLSPRIAKTVLGSFDYQKNILTLVFCQVDTGALYVNSKWEIQKDPYDGDVVNSYNDGPLDDGSQLGPFYEIETSSPALELKRFQSAVHRQVTIHLEGPLDELRAISLQLLNFSLDEPEKK